MGRATHSAASPACAPLSALLSGFSSFAPSWQAKKLLVEPMKVLGMQIPWWESDEMRRWLCGRFRKGA